MESCDHVLADVPICSQLPLRAGRREFRCGAVLLLLLQCSYKVETFEAQDGSSCSGLVVLLAELLCLHLHACAVEDGAAS